MNQVNQIIFLITRITQIDDVNIIIGKTDNNRVCQLEIADNVFKPKVDDEIIIRSYN